MASNEIIHFIGGHEGKVLSWYLDPTGTPTIGYGFTWASKVFREWFLKEFGRKMRKGDKITETQALYVLKLMYESEYEPPVRHRFPKATRSNVIEAAGSMVFNCGPGALNWKWAAAITRGDIKEGARLWRQTGTTSRGQRLPGLVRRRSEEADIAEFNRWPAWMKDVTPSVIPTAPASHISVEDVRQGQTWLKTLGYYTGGIDGIVGGKTKFAVERFQRDHGNLTVDGILGRATLSALQRAIDLRNKGAGVIVTGGSASGAGVAEGATGAGDAIIPPSSGIDAAWLEPLLIWGGLALIVVGVVYLAWRYQDEINTIVRKL